MEENLLSLRQSLSENAEVSVKRPAAKDQMARAPAGLKRPAATLKRPAAAVGTSEPEGQKKQKQQQEAAQGTALKRPAGKTELHISVASKTRASADERNRLLREIPAAVRKQYANGCGTCRWRPGCCVSCWKKRGYFA